VSFKRILNIFLTHWYSCSSCMGFGIFTEISVFAIQPSLMTTCLYHRRVG
jgi:hypothetical protein